MLPAERAGRLGVVLITVELGLTASGNILYAVVFLLVGLGMRRRFHDPARPFAATAFVLWWFVMTAQAATFGVAQASVLLGFDSPLLHRTLFTFALLFASLQIWALGHYILYLWGAETRRARIPLTVFSAAYFLYFFILLAVVGGAGVVEGRWGAGLGLNGAAEHLPFLSTLLLLPVFALISAYYVLAFRAETPTQKTRVLVLATAAAIWNIAQISQFAAQAGRDGPLHGFMIALNLAWGILLWLTYYPPVTVRRIFGIKGLDVASGVDKAP